MHLSASCGYLECVETLLSYGADITLRNAIGQTPLEEAEVSGLKGSEKCVARLRGVWRQLEEEAASRMLAMLELEESAADANRSSSKKSKKKHKHKSGKRKTAKPVAPAAESIDPTDDTPEAVEEDSDDDGEYNDHKTNNTESKGEEVDAKTDGDTKDHSEHDLEPSEATSDADNSLAAAGAWTTVGRKHRGGSVSASANAEAEALQHIQKSPQKKTTAPQRMQRHPRIVPQSSNLAVAKGPPVLVTPPAFKAQLGPNSSTLGHRDRSAPWSKPAEAASTNSAPKGSDASSPPANVEEVVSPAPPPSRPDTAEVSSGIWHAPIEPTTLTGTIGLPTSSSSFVSTSRPLYSGPVYANASSTSSRFLWRHHPSHYYHYQQHHQYPTRVGVYGPPMTVQDATARWISKLGLGNPTVADTMALLACGLCGELVDDNLQCTSGDSSSRACTQLYCSLCVLRVGTSAERFACVKCRQEVSRASMRRNEFAQQQAASLALSIRHGQDNGSSVSHLGVYSNSSTHAASLSPAEVQQALYRAVPRAEAVDLQACDLVPGMVDLTTLSNGQLEVLDEAHAAARQKIVDQMMTNARSVEREQMLEWLKLHRVSIPSLSPSVSDLWRAQQ